MRQRVKQQQLHDVRTAEKRLHQQYYLTGQCMNRAAITAQEEQHSDENNRTGTRPPEDPQFLTECWFTIHFPNLSGIAVFGKTGLLSDVVGGLPVQSKY